MKIFPGLHRIAATLALGPLVLGLALAQEEPRNIFASAPPDVDQALRARIAKFYQFFVAGKFRLADALVAEDSKDVFFAAEKRKFQDFSIGSVTYSDNFTKAVAVVSCGTDQSFMGTKFPIKLPLTSFWKLEDGEWFWYVIPADQQKTYHTPGGDMPRPPTAEEQNSTANNSAPTSIIRPMISPEQLMKAVQLDREMLTFDSSKASKQVIHLTNSLGGRVSVAATTPIKGLKVTPSKGEMDAKQELEMEFAFDPGDSSIVCSDCLAHPQDRPAGEVTIVVEPTGQMIRIPIRFLVLPPASAAK